MLFAAAMTAGAFAQVEGKVRGGLDIGAAIPKGGGGVCVNIPFGYNLKDNMNIGIRLGTAAMAKIDPFGEVGDLAANVNFLGTFNYYFNSGDNPVAPFVGCGAGIYTIAAVSGGGNSVTVEAGNRFGGMMTAGVEVAKFRLALEYNMIPSSAVKVTGTGSGVAITNDKIKNSYFAFTVGFYIGGGKWKK